MSYEKQNFKDGQVLTAEMLNKMEEGIANAGGSGGGGAYYVNITTNDDGTYSADKTVSEIIDAVNGGNVAIVKHDMGGGFITIAPLSSIWGDMGVSFTSIMSEDGIAYNFVYGIFPNGVTVEQVQLNGTT